MYVGGQDEFSECFAATNGVKQGGVISPTLFCVYMDGLLTELSNSGYGCYMGGVFTGLFVYAHDHKLLTHSVYALHIVWHICLKIMLGDMILHLMLRKIRLSFIKLTMNDLLTPMLKLKVP